MNSLKSILTGLRVALLTTSGLTLNAATETGTVLITGANRGIGLALACGLWCRYCGDWVLAVRQA